jgi:hypothetical protein
VISYSLASFSFVGFVLAGVIVALGLSVIFGPVGVLLGILVLVLCVAFAFELSSFLADSLGNIVAFILVFWIVRQLFNLGGPTQWPKTEAVAPDSDEFKRQAEYFQHCCTTWEHKYDFKLRIKHIYRVNADHPIAQARPLGSEDPNARYLFHGTPRDSAKGIVLDGFRLPDKPGMFGKGIYFADCPLKSWRYCFPTQALSDMWPGLILMCWVTLGKERRQQNADHGLTGYREKRGFSKFVAWARGSNDVAYDSIVGETEEVGGALRVPEYVIYTKDRARVDYIFEVVKESGSATRRQLLGT